MTSTNRTTYMFSEKAKLACWVQGNEYHVYNGAWTGIRNGDNFTIEGGRGTIIIDDWEELSLIDISEEEREQWYLPTVRTERQRMEQQERLDRFDDDIPF